MDEYIKREALLDDFGEEPMVWTDSDSEIQERLDWYRYKGIVEMQPAADVAPVRHGRWFDTGVENETGNVYFCSVCNKYNNPNKKDVQMKRAKEKPAYCPNCGAKMDGETP